MSKRKHDTGDDDQSGPRKVKARLEPASYAETGMIQVLVGVEKRRFHVHKELLFSQSPYCAAQENFNQGVPLETINLPDVPFKYFHVIFNWLYTGRLSITSRVVEKRVVPLRNDHWIELYHCADVLLMTNMQNVLVDADLASVNANGRISWHPNYMHHWHVNDVAHTPYYRLFLADIVRHYLEGGYQGIDFASVVDRLIDYPTAMADWLKSIDNYRKKKWQSVEKEARCKWHIHDEGETCS